MIKYSWARYKDRPVHISEITVEMREEDNFYNLQTGKRMTAYLNGRFERHFHHIEYANHDNETYLHETAKEVFKNTYIKCLVKGIPYEVQFRKARNCQQHFKRTGVVCELDDVLATFDLTQRFKDIRVEKRYDEFQPDIQLLSRENETVKDVIFVEIFVTHKSSENKIQKGKRIIEIKICSEDDILRLRNCKLSVSDVNTTFHNFKRTTEVINYCAPHEKGCRTFVHAFVLYKNGAYEFLDDALENVVSHVASEESRIVRVDYKAFQAYSKDASEKDKRNWYLGEAINKGWKVKDCRYCRYQGDKTRKNVVIGLFCKFLKQDIEFNTAWDCNYFRSKSGS